MSPFLQQLIVACRNTERTSDFAYSWFLHHVTRLIGLLTQIVKEELFAEILQFLRGGKTFLKGTESIDLHVKLRREYPILMDILLGLCDD